MFSPETLRRMRKKTRDKIAGFLMIAYVAAAYVGAHIWDAYDPHHHNEWIFWPVLVIVVVLGGWVFVRLADWASHRD